jgi:hypothetical protein
MSHTLSIRMRMLPPVLEDRCGNLGPVAAGGREAGGLAAEPSVRAALPGPETAVLGC